MSSTPVVAQGASERIVSNIVPPTIYEEPEKTLLNFPSSIMNGITQEGGLSSLTLKSVKCVELVENFEMVRDTLVMDVNADELPRINEEDFDGKSALQTLEEEIRSLEAQAAEYSKRNSDGAIKESQKTLSDLVSQKQDLHQFGTDIIDKYKKEYNIDSVQIGSKITPVKDLDVTSLGIKEA